jgi:hypothetical protein
MSKNHADAVKEPATQTTSTGPVAPTAVRPAASQPRPAPDTQATSATQALQEPVQMARSHAFSKAATDLRKLQSTDGMLQHLSTTPIESATGMNAARYLQVLTGAPQAAQQGMGIEDYMKSPIRTDRSVARKGKAPEPKLAAKPAETLPTLGSLCARFESGSEGIAAIGYDSTGGTSYGKFQIASRVGGMKDFMKFLDTEAPDIAERLRKAGPANTGSKYGKMPKVWKQIAQESPERFDQLQEAFILQSHYKPAMESIVARTGLTKDTLSPAMQEVIFSTAVQHGPTGAARIFDVANARSGKSTDAGYERKLIQNVYSVRTGQFGSSTPAVQASVARRFQQEKLLALNMLDSGTNTLA